MSSANEILALSPVECKPSGACSPRASDASSRRPGALLGDDLDLDRRARLGRALHDRVEAQLRGDLGGAAYLATTAAFVGICTWVLPALVVPALGCAALAVVAIPGRPRGPRG